jgi:hypothetical protein
VLNKSFLLGCVCALGLAASPALAGDFSGTITGNYLNADVHAFGGSANGNAWGGGAELQGGVGDIHGQINGSYNSLSFSGANLNVSTVDGSLFMPFESGRIGATVGYTSLGGDASGNQTNYGAFGEFWAADNFTLGAKFGGITGGGDSAGYWGGEAIFYAMPDLALNGQISGISNGGETDYTASAEYLVSEDTPISVGGGYTYVNIGSGGGHVDVWFAKATLYFGDDSAKTLVDHHRTGNLGWLTGTSNTGLQF